MVEEKRILLLDATLRDGGQGLEDGYRQGFYKKQYGSQFVVDVVDKLVSSDIDIVELGAIGPSVDDKSMFAIYQNIEDLSKKIPIDKNPNQKYVGLYIGPDTDISNIPDRDNSLVDGVRVILRYSELEKSLKYCAALSRKGYKVFVQPMLTMRYTPNELNEVIKASNDMNVFALYIVDSYGYMNSNDIDKLFDVFEKGLNPNIRIGFHAHNNTNMAFANVQHFLSKQTNHKLIVDSCILGIGQGAGNLQTELIVPYLNKQYGTKYNFDSVLDLCDVFEKKFLKDNVWGYSIDRLLPALHYAAYKYGPVLRKKYKLSYKEINSFLSMLSYEDKQRYTDEVLQKLLINFKKK